MGCIARALVMGVASATHPPPESLEGEGERLVHMLDGFAGTAPTLRRRFPFHERLQALQRLIPLRSDRVQRAARLVDARRLQFPQAFATLANVVHEARVGQYFQVFGDGLPGDRGAVRELRDR